MPCSPAESAIARHLMCASAQSRRKRPMERRLSLYNIAKISRVVPCFPRESAVKWHLMYISARSGLNVVRERRLDLCDMAKIGTNMLIVPEESAIEWHPICNRTGSPTATIARDRLQTAGHSHFAEERLLVSRYSYRSTLRNPKKHRSLDECVFREREF